MSYENEKSKTTLNKARYNISYLVVVAFVSKFHKRWSLSTTDHCPGSVVASCWVIEKDPHFER